jgi:thaumarchaeosortase
VLKLPSNVKGYLINLPGRLILHLRGNFKPSDLTVLALSFPVLLLLAVDPGSFEFSWSIWGHPGRGGFIFALFFLLVDWMDARKTLSPILTGKTLAGFALCASAVSLYFGAVCLHPPFFDFLVNLGKDLGMAMIASWLALLDYLVYTAYTLAVQTLLFGFKNLRKFPIPAIYLTGMALIISFDAFIPYSSIGPFQGLISIIVITVASMLRLCGVQVETFWGYRLSIWGKKGFLIIDIYWPCAGIHSMVIYFLIIAVLMIRLDAPHRRKLIYAAFGAVGTFFINILRVFLICYYGAFVSLNVELFHQSIGEILFLIWIVIYLIAVIKIESLIIQKARKPAA